MSNPPEVMVLDDESIVCEMLKAHLEKCGMAVETFTESREAVSRLADKRFDVIITDLKMKAPNGLDIMHFVRRQGNGTQVIIITAYSSIEAAREAEYSGAFGFIDKPFQMENLARMAKKAAAKAQRAGGRSSNE